jgi:hypothetical protein
MNTYLDDIRFSTAAVGLILQQIGAPQESFPTPPWMSRRFADSLIRCHSLEEIAPLVEREPRDAAAFLMTAFHVIDQFEVGECTLSSPAGATEITAAGHAIITFLDAVEAVYPEGLTEYQHDANS